MASSSSSNLRWNHDVFLSFRGEDTRYNFTDHLYNHLLQRGITTFRDDRLTRGEEIQSELLNAIESSRSSIVVFSKTYADSRWCLDELAKIMECRKENRQIVVPVFYHVDPSEVRKQTGSFGEAFSNHEKNWKNKVQGWREALTEAGNISGWRIEVGYESKYIKEIAIDIFKRLNYKYLFVGENLVGMDFYLRELTSKLKMHTKDVVRIVGIWGVGGIGKTTIAKAIYNQIAPEFDCISFLENVKEIHKAKGLHGLQKQLLYDITGEKYYISNISQGAQIIQNTLQFRKVLIVFDDIDDNLKQLEYLVGEHHWFERGSRVLITTRDRNLLHKVDDICEMEGLNLKDALKLFSLYAFQQNLPEEDYKILSDDVIHYCQGLPLALKVLGSLLRGKRRSEWESELHKLKNLPNAKIQDVLKTSYDELDRIEQTIFLDIVCFFKGEDRDFVSRILDGCEMNGESGIGVLMAKCLITFSDDNKIYMHDLIQQMGWEIIREHHPKDPSKWSRLWNQDDIHHAFMSKKGMKDIETISLELSRSREIWFTEEVLTTMKIKFAKMKKLRLLKVYYSDDLVGIKNKKTSLPEGFEFPRELRYLHWEGLESLPANFDPENLVAINLKFSNTKKLWKRKKHHEKLKFVDVSDSQQLIKVPKFSSMTNLERLNIGGCTSLPSIGVFPYEMKFLKELLLNKIGIEELPSSIGYLTSLEILDVSWCLKFQILPDSFWNMRCLRKLSMRGTRIKELPGSIGYLETLESLDLSHCRNFENFPEMLETKCLKELLLDRTDIKELPSSIGYLELLETIDLTYCSNFKKFPEIEGNMKCLKELLLAGTAIKELPNSIGYLESLQTISLRQCSKFEKFPKIQGTMKCLKSLDLEKTAIKELPDKIVCLEALEELKVSGCSNLEKFPKVQRNMRCLSRLYINGTGIKELHHSISNLKGLLTLSMENCKSLKSLPDSMCELKSLQEFRLNGCSNLDHPDDFWEIIQKMERLQGLHLDEMAAIIEVPSSIGRLKNLWTLRLSNCENLVTLPNNLGSLSSLRYLDVSKTRIHRIPASIAQLSELEELLINHCTQLEEIPELPSSLREIQARGCPRLKALLSDPTTDLLWSSLLNSFKLYIENIICKQEKYLIWKRIHAVVPPPPGGRTKFLDIWGIMPIKTGIPKWVMDKSTGCEISIELPNKWYEDDSFLGFALFFHFVPLDDKKSGSYRHPYCEFSISQGDQFMSMNGYMMMNIYNIEGLEVLAVLFFPQIGIPNEYRSKKWKYFKACITRNPGIKSCGIHLISAQNQPQA